MRITPRTFPALWLIIAAAFLGCTAIPSAGQALEKKPAEAGAGPAAAALPELYRLRRGDEVSISVVPQKEFDCGGVILPDGIVYLNNLGPVKADGMTIPELEKRIRALLEDELIEPRVRVALVRLAPLPPATQPPVKPRGRITIIGAIARSGPLDLEEDLRLRKALDLVGGATPQADLTQVAITHRDLKRTVVNISSPEKVANLAQNVILQDGDSVEIPLLPPSPPKVANPVRIAGVVGAPGQYELRQGMTLEDLIIVAGKLSPLADVEHVELRRVEQKPRNVDLLAQRKLGLDGKVFLEPGDEIMVPEMKDTVLLVGAVSSPGPRPFKPGQTIRDFFLLSNDAGVLNPANVSLAKTQVIRRGVKKNFNVDLQQVLKKPVRKDNLVLETGDIIFLPPRRDRGRGIYDYLRDVPMVGFLFGLF